MNIYYPNTFICILHTYQGKEEDLLIFLLL